MAEFSNNTVTNNQENDGVVISFAKIFGYMFVGLLITAVIAICFGAICQYTGISVGAMNAILITCAILQLVLTIVIQFKVLKDGSNSITVPAILYCVLMGFLLGSFGAVLDWRLLGMAFGITSLIFLLMTGIVLISKGKFNIFGVLAIGLIVGAGLLTLVNFIIMWTNPQGAIGLYWAISFIIFGAMLCITIFDIYNIKKIAEAGAMNKNTMMFCAFRIYVDFIAILIRILYYLAIAVGRSR